MLTAIIHKLVTLSGSAINDVVFQSDLFMNLLHSGQVWQDSADSGLCYQFPVRNSGHLTWPNPKLQQPHRHAVLPVSYYPVTVLEFAIVRLQQVLYPDQQWLWCLSVYHSKAVYSNYTTLTYHCQCVWCFSVYHSKAATGMLPRPTSDCDVFVFTIVRLCTTTVLPWLTTTSVCDVLVFTIVRLQQVLYRD